MRYLLRNAVRDLALESVRRAHPGKVLLRPMVGGRPLPAGGVRYLNLADFTESLLDEIEYLSGIGNVQLLMAGRPGVTANLDDIRRLRGLPLRVRGVAQDSIVMDEVATFPSVEVPEEAVVEATVAEEPTSPAPESPSPLPEEPETSPSEFEPLEDPPEESFPEKSLTEDIEEMPASTIEESAAPVAEEPPTAPVEAPVTEVSAAPTAEALLEMKLTDLRIMLVKLGGKASGKNKDDLVSEILERQGS